MTIVSGLKFLKINRMPAFYIHQYDSNLTFPLKWWTLAAMEESLVITMQTEMLKFPIEISGALRVFTGWMRECVKYLSLKVNMLVQG